MQSSIQIFECRAFPAVAGMGGVRQGEGVKRSVSHTAPLEPEHHGTLHFKAHATGIRAADAAHIYGAPRFFRDLSALVRILEGRYIKAYHSEDEHERLLVWGRCLTSCDAA